MSDLPQLNQAQAETMWRALSSLETDVGTQLLVLAGEGRAEDEKFLTGVKDTVETALLQVRQQAEPKDEDVDLYRTPQSRREAIIDRAVCAAELVILEGSDGTCEETDFLTGSVAVEFVRKSHGRLADTLLHLDLSTRASAHGAG